MCVRECVNVYFHFCNAHFKTFCSLFEYIFYECLVHTNPKPSDHCPLTLYMFVPVIILCLLAQYEKEHSAVRKITSMCVRQSSFSTLIEYFNILLCHYTLTHCTRSLKLQFNILVSVPCTRKTAVSIKLNCNDLCYIVLLYFDRRSSILKVFCIKDKGNLMFIHL